jgi:hypothetical protein
MSPPKQAVTSRSRWLKASARMEGIESAALSMMRALRSSSSRSRSSSSGRSLPAWCSAAKI